MKSFILEAVRDWPKSEYAIIARMTKLLEEGIKAVQGLPEDRQNDAGEMLLAIAGNSDRYQLTPEQIEDVKLAIAETDRGEFASDEEMAALWKKCGL